MSAMRARAVSFLAGRQIGRAAARVSIACRRSAEVLALLESQANQRIQLPELRVDSGSTGS